MATRYLAYDEASNLIANTKTISRSHGPASAGRIIETDSNGHFHITFLPVGIGPDSAREVYNGQPIPRGSYVYLTQKGPGSSVYILRKADSHGTNPAQYFILTDFISVIRILIYPLWYPNTALSGLVPGREYYLGRNGRPTDVAPSPATQGSVDQLIQVLGVAVSTTELEYLHNRASVLLKAP